MDADSAALFNRRLVLPDPRIAEEARRLVGFADRSNLIIAELSLLVARTRLERWSTQHYRGLVPLIDVVSDLYPIALFHGEPGNGKSSTAVAVANQIVTPGDRPGLLLALGTQVRGAGEVGEMSQ